MIRRLSSGGCGRCFARARWGAEPLCLFWFGCWNVFLFLAKQQPTHPDLCVTAGRLLRRSIFVCPEFRIRLRPHVEDGQVTGYNVSVFSYKAEA